jgi:uncharacterized membrane protein YeaQ/YmgE (transglycosylase-associated protein family)
MTLVVGALIGYVASLIVKGEGLGLIGDLFIGILGAWVGRWLAGSVGIQATNTVGSLLISILGAVVLLVVLRALVGGKGRKA